MAPRSLHSRARAARTPQAMAALLKHAHPLAWYRPGRRVEVNDRMQRGYSYTLSARPGRGFESGFRPQVSPARMLRMGIFEGKYLNDCLMELPREWYAGALRAGRLSPGGADPRLNAFGIRSRLSLRAWRRNGWLPQVRGDPDVRGWLQWYCRYWLGRRDARVDARQIARWRAFRRHQAQILASYRRFSRGARPRTRAQKRAHRPRQRQALLQWAYNPYI